MVFSLSALPGYEMQSDLQGKNTISPAYQIQRIPEHYTTPAVFLVHLSVNSNDISLEVSFHFSAFLNSVIYPISFDNM